MTGVSVLAMEATEAPVSMAVELETLVTSALRYCSGVRRWGLDWMRDFFCMERMITILCDHSTVSKMAVNIGGEPLPEVPESN